MKVVTWVLAIVILLNFACFLKAASETPSSSLLDWKDGPPDSPSVGDTWSNSIGITFVWIPPGKFLMGSPETEQDSDKTERPQHEAILSRGFWMSKFEVTQKQWVKLMKHNPSCFKHIYCPIEGISWFDCKMFIERLNKQEETDAYSLPTETMWEYACRAGTTSRFAFGDELTKKHANFNSFYPYIPDKEIKFKYTRPVGTYKPNAWGLYDMHGNVEEWCEDYYVRNYYLFPNDGTANERLYVAIEDWDTSKFSFRLEKDSQKPPVDYSKYQKKLKVVRGGSWQSRTNVECRSASRMFAWPKIGSYPIDCAVIEGRGAEVRHRSTYGLRLVRQP